MTTGRRSSPVPQLNCIGGSARGLFNPQVCVCVFAVCVCVCCLCVCVRLLFVCVCVSECANAFVSVLRVFLMLLSQITIPINAFMHLLCIAS